MEGDIITVCVCVQHSHSTLTQIVNGLGVCLLLLLCAVAFSMICYVANALLLWCFCIWYASI